MPEIHLCAEFIMYMIISGMEGYIPHSLILKPVNLHFMVLILGLFNDIE